MYIKGDTVTNAKFEVAAELAGVRISELDYQEERSRWKIRLGLLPDKKWQSINIWWNGTERRTGSVCFHGHYEFFKELFKLAPDATVESNWYGRWKHTKDTLDDNAYEMAHIIVGSQMNPYELGDKCNCRMEDVDAL